MLARRLREEIGRQLSKDHTRYTVKVGRLRKLLMERVGDRRKRQKILKEISEVDISETCGHVHERAARALPQ